MHLKVLLRIRYINNIKYNKWDKFGHDKFCGEFEVFLHDVLSSFTGMLDITLVLDEILSYNDLTIAMLLHDKLENYHDYVITYIRFLLQQSKKKEYYLRDDIEYRHIVLNRIISKLLLLKARHGQNNHNNNISLKNMSHAQGRCLAHLIALWMELKLPLSEIEKICVKEENFDNLKYGLNNLLFHNWCNHQTTFDQNTMPQFSPKLMLKITQFALQSQKRL